MRIAAGLFLSLAILACNGCIAVVAAVAAGVTVTATHNHPGSPGAAPPAAEAAPPAEAMPLSAETAGKLARAGTVVLVEAGSGASVDLPWHSGLRLSQAAQSGRLSGGFSRATIFRDGRTMAADMKAPGGGDLLLRSGDVVELRH